MSRNQKPVDVKAAPQIQQKPAHLCAFKSCQQPGEFHLIGDASLCIEHFLRDRVRLNLASMGI